VVASIGDAMTHQNDSDAKGALKTQADLERYRRIIAETAPDLIIECGTLAGGSAQWFADTAHCTIITVDIQPQVGYDMWLRWAGRVRPFQGSSTDPKIVRRVARIAAKHSRVMVVLDSDHSTDHVAAELEAYAPLVTPGCFMVVEDTLVRWMPWWNVVGNPLDAVEAHLAAHPDEWVQDSAIENMSPTSQHPGGFLRRIR